MNLWFICTFNYDGKYLADNSWIATDLKCGDRILFNKGTTSSRKHWLRLTNDTDAVIDLRRDCQILCCRVCFWWNCNWQLGEWGVLKESIFHTLRLEKISEGIPQLLLMEIWVLVNHRIRRVDAILQNYTAYKDIQYSSGDDWSDIVIDRESRTSEKQSQLPSDQDRAFSVADNSHTHLAIFYYDRGNNSIVYRNKTITWIS